MNVRYILGVIGLFGLLFGVVVGLGFVPTLATTGVSGGSGGASFAWSVAGSNVTVVDESALPVAGCTTTGCTSGVAFTSLTISWDSNGTVSSISLHSSSTHRYALAGTHFVAESLTYQICVGSPPGAAHPVRSCGSAVSLARAAITTGTGGGHSGGVSVNPAFTATLKGSGLVTVNDTTTTSNATELQALLLWGDGTPSVSIAPQGTATHAYSVSGTYAITEDVTWEAVGSTTTYNDSVASNVTVDVANNSACQGVCVFHGGLTNPPSNVFFVVNSYSLGFMLGFGALMVLGLTEALDVRWTLVVSLLLFLAGFAFGAVAHISLSTVSWVSGR